MVTDMREKAKKNYRTVDIQADHSTGEQLCDWLRYHKSCCLQSSHELFLHAIFLYGMVEIYIKFDYKVQTDL